MKCQRCQYQPDFSELCPSCENNIRLMNELRAAIPQTVVHDDDSIMEFRARGVMYLSEDDEWYEEYRDRLEKEGFAPSELWNLDVTIAMFVLPRLRALRELEPWPNTPMHGYDKLYENIDKSICAFEIVLSDRYTAFDEEADLIVSEGIKAFAEVFPALWC